MFGSKLLRRRYNRYFQKPAAWSIYPGSACALRATDHRYVPPPGYYTPDWVFANLDLNGLSTGLLQEHGTPFTRLSAFNGDPDSTTVSTPLRCRLVQATLLSATVNANAQVDTAALPAESGSDTFGYQTLLYTCHKPSSQPSRQTTMFPLPPLAIAPDFPYLVIAFSPSTARSTKKKHQTRRSLYGRHLQLTYLNKKNIRTA